MEAEGDALTAAGLARLAGVGEAEIGRMVELGVLVPRDGPAPFLPRDLHKLRLVVACERAGLPMDGIAVDHPGRPAVVRVHGGGPRTPRWAVPSDRTYRQVSAETGVSLDDLRAALEAMGFAWLSPDEPMREDELEVVPLVRLAFSSGHLRPGVDGQGRPGLRRGPAPGRPGRERVLPGPVRGAGAALPGSASTGPWSWPRSWRPSSCPWSTRP